MVLRSLRIATSITVALFCCVLLASCVKNTDRQAYATAQSPATDLPERIAVLAPEFVPASEGGALLDASDADYVASLVRGTVSNQLIGKGYMVKRSAGVEHILAVSQAESDAELCDALDVDAIARVTILDASMLMTSALDSFVLEAEVEIVRANGESAALWKSESSKRKVSIPTSLIGLAGMLVEGVLSDPARHQMRMVVYDWGWKVGKMIPVSSGQDQLPQVQYVESNIERQVFGAGQRVEILVAAEADLKCSFDIGRYRTEIPLHRTEQGVYRGAYVVRKGDDADRQPLLVRLTDPKGLERVWIEPGAVVILDGIAPQAPQNVIPAPERDGVGLSWDVPSGEELSGFVVERADSAAGIYSPIGDTRKASFTDEQAPPGAFAFYRVRAKDAAGNLSEPRAPVEVAVPRFSEEELTGELTGVLVPGPYVLNTTASIPEGEKLTLMPGVKLRFAPDAGLDVLGGLKAQGSRDRTILFTGADWRGLRIAEEGRAVISNAAFKQCINCVDSAGYLELNKAVFSGSGGTAVSVSGGGAYALSGLTVSGFDTGVWLDAAEGRMSNSTLYDNVTGVQVDDPGAVVEYNNVTRNGLSFVAAEGVTLRANWHGTALESEISVPEGVILKSYLNAPFPHGAEVLLLDAKTLTPQDRDLRFARHKEAGIAAFGERRYGDAVQELTEAMRYGADRDTFVYMAYVRMALKEKDKLEDLLQRGIEAYPHEVRLYKVYFRYLAGQKRFQAALRLADRALELNPDDYGLKSLKEYVKVRMEEAQLR